MQKRDDVERNRQNRAARRGGIIEARPQKTSRDKPRPPATTLCQPTCPRLSRHAREDRNRLHVPTEGVCKSGHWTSPVETEAACQVCEEARGRGRSGLPLCRLLGCALVLLELPSARGARAEEMELAGIVPSEQRVAPARVLGSRPARRRAKKKVSLPKFTRATPPRPSQLT